MLTIYKKARQNDNVNTLGTFIYHQTEEMQRTTMLIKHRLRYTKNIVSNIVRIYGLEMFE